MRTATKPTAKTAVKQPGFVTYQLCSRRVRHTGPCGDFVRAYAVNYWLCGAKKPRGAK